jgi:hypothetical protein
MAWYLVKHRDNFTLLYFTLLCYILTSTHVNVGPCHHGMTRPRVADGGDGLQIWRLAANIWNKQSRTADKR